MDIDKLHPTDDPLVMRAKSNGTTYTERACEGCGSLAWIRKGRRYCSHSCSALNHRGENNPNWVGDAAGYATRHDRLQRIRGEADHCIHRNAIGCTSNRFESAHIHGEDPYDIYSYVPLCKSCHAKYDPKRDQQGSKNAQAKLTEEIAAEILCRVSAGESQASLAREYDVSTAAVCKLVHGVTWATAQASAGTVS